MLPGASERYVPIPEGYEGSVLTLRRMAVLLREADPVVDEFAAMVAETSDDPLSLVRLVFEWVRKKMLYTPDFNNGVVVEEIRTPGYLLREMVAFGSALGDCDDYVTLTGAVLYRLGFPVTLEAISRSEDLQLDHVYLSTVVNGERVVLDGIVDEPFGWEVPAEEVTNRESLLVA